MEGLIKEFYLSNYGLNNKFDDIGYFLFKVLGYWTTITNILCCVILGFVIRFVQQITKQPLDFAVTLQSEELQEKNNRYSKCIT